MTAKPATASRRRPFGGRIALTAFALLAVLVAACGGGTPATTARASASGAAPTLAPLGSPAPGDTGAPEETDAGGSPGPSGADGAMCKKVSIAEMGAIVGSTVTITEGSDTECTWTTAGFEGINLRIESNSTDLRGQKLLFTDGRDISGVGETAFWAPSVSVLYAVYHGKVYAAQLVLFTVDDLKNLGIATAILQKALSRI